MLSAFHHSLPGWSALAYSSLTEVVSPDGWVDAHSLESSVQADISLSLAFQYGSCTHFLNSHSTKGR